MICPFIKTYIAADFKIKNVISLLFNKRLFNQSTDFIDALWLKELTWVIGFNLN
ncbi:MAG: hypothetical protein OFPII_14940 [Osedax symbiont Rs1]|nr:MAG: hypothetical protein OFPII_14940 [Osedax symbiont Rs1]